MDKGSQAISGLINLLQFGNPRFNSNASTQSISPVPAGDLTPKEFLST